MIDRTVCVSIDESPPVNLLTLSSQVSNLAVMGGGLRNGVLDLIEHPSVRD